MFRPATQGLSDRQFREYDHDVRAWNANCDVVQLQAIQRAAAGQPLRLHAAWRGGFIEFSLFCGSEPLVPISRKPIQKQVIRDLISEIQELTRQASAAYGAATADPVAVRSELELLGRSMYSRLLTTSIQQRLKAAAQPELFLGLDQTLVEVPWELLCDGEQFLCRRFQVGRHVFAEVREKADAADLQAFAAAKPAGPPYRMLMIADPTGTLPGAQRECELIAAALAQLPDVDLKIIGKEVRRSWDLHRQLTTGYDLVHYAGHAHYDSKHPDNSAWLLADGKLTATDVASLTPPPRLVFANACESGATGAWRDGFAYEDKAFGLASGFLLAGVQGYIGTFWRVHDEASADLASAFYRALLAGETVGSALALARQTVIDRYGWGEIVWASYMLYGDPAQRSFPRNV
jgi:CHAT domain-containing protein